MKRLSSMLAFLAAGVSLTCCSVAVPASWMKSWRAPSVSDRPLKMVHRVPADESPYGGDYFRWLRDSCGIGGAVLSYVGRNYLEDEGEWAVLADEVRRAENAGLRVWIYDEEGYPSLSAGGRVLEKDPSVEAEEMVYDSSMPEGKQYYVRNSYEFTHACNNYASLRRYPDPGNPRSMELFTGLTHENMKKHLGADLFSGVEAFFTDEPSYMGVNLGPIPAKVRQQVRVQDQPDPSRKLLPSVAWTKDIEKDYQLRYAEDLMSRVQSLFGGGTEADKVTRQRYWSLMGDRFRNSYCDVLEKWCSGAGTLSSGHFLSEEQVVRNVPLYGNILECEAGLDIPGMDMLDTDPPRWNTGGGLCWLIASLPESAAFLDGKRRVMSEISDHNQSVLGDAPATVEAMKGTAACHMAGGVTDLALYYAISYDGKFPFRNARSFKSYSEFVGRINSILREAEPVKDVILYYPSYDCQREYIPNPEPLMDERAQSPEMKSFIKSFVSAGSALSRSQIPFVVADYRNIGKALEKGKTLVIPADVDLPSTAEQSVKDFVSAGGHVVYESGECSDEDIRRDVDPCERFSPSSPEIVSGKFIRSGRTVYLVVNASERQYEGSLSVPSGGRWSVLDPDSGVVTSVKSFSADGIHRLKVSMKPLQTLIYISR